MALFHLTLVMLSDFAFANTNGDTANDAMSKMYADTLQRQ